MTKTPPIPETGPSPASTYNAITKAVAALIAEHTANDPTIAAYFIARAALVHMANVRGGVVAARKALQLAEELADFAERRK